WAGPIASEPARRRQGRVSQISRACSDCTGSRTRGNDVGRGRFMKRIRRALAGAYALLALAGCLNYSMVPPERTTVAGAFSVMPSVAWNKSTLHGDERWTLDGNSLQEIIFLNVGDNQRLMSAVLGGPGLGEPVVRPANDKIPAYLSSMTPYDIKEIIEAS